MDEDLTVLGQFFDERSQLVKKKIRMLQELNKAGGETGSPAFSTAHHWNEEELLEKKKEAEESLKREGRARKLHLQREIGMLQSQTEALKAPQKIGVVIHAETHAEGFRALFLSSNVELRFFVVPQSCNRDTIQHSTLPVIVGWCPDVIVFEVMPGARQDTGGPSLIPCIGGAVRHVICVVHGGDNETRTAISLGCRLLLRPPLNQQSVESLLRRLRESTPPGPFTPPRHMRKTPPTRTPPIPAMTCSPSPYRAIPVPAATPVPVPVACDVGDGFNNTTPVRVSPRVVVSTSGDTSDAPIFNEKPPREKSNSPGKDALVVSPDQVPKFAHFFAERDEKWKAATADLMAEVTNLRAELQKANDLNDMLMEKVG